MNAARGPGAQQQRVRAFVDLREFRRGLDAAVGGTCELDWEQLAPWLATGAVATATGLPVSDLRSVGALVYLPATRDAADAHSRRWTSLTPVSVPGVTVVPDKGAAARESMCAGCGSRGASCGRRGLGATGGEGGLVMRSDLLRLSREDVFDWAVLVSSDRRLVPVVEFLVAKGRSVVHAGFRPHGRQLAAACAASVDLGVHLGRFLRAC
jgi:uncharacterized LabA/DUF88 family protein